MASHYDEGNVPTMPCRPSEHKFAMNGKCWRCNHSRDGLAEAAGSFLRMHGYFVAAGTVACPKCYWVFTPTDETLVKESSTEIQFQGSGVQLAAECLALLRDKPTALEEFCQTLGAPVPRLNEEG